MSNSQQFDKYVKEQFSNYAPDVHPRIWENIAARKEKKKPAGFWQLLAGNRSRIILAALLLAVSTGTGWWYYNSTHSATAPVSSSASKESSGKTTADEKNNPVQGQQPVTVSEQPVTGNTVDAASGPDKQNTAGSVLTNKDLPATAGTSGNNDAGTGPGKKAAANTRSVSASGKLRIDNGSVQADTESASTGINENISRSAKKQKGTGSRLRINSTAAASAETDQEEEYAVGGSLLGRLSFDAAMMTAKKKAKNPLALTFQQIAFLPDCPSFEKNASGNKKYLEIYAGPDYAFRSFSDTGNSEYLRRRKESTRFSSAFSAGVRYTRVFSNSMSVRAGFNYSQINEKFTFTQGNLVQITYIIGSNGDTLGSYTTTGTRYKTTINKYRSFDIPLALGYELGNGRWHANINAGVVVNIYSWQKGDVLDQSYQPVNITTGKSSSPYQFKTNAGVGFMGGVAVYYKLNDRFHLMAEPYFRYNFSPLNKDNITLKQKYQTAGLRVGIRVDLK